MSILQIACLGILLLSNVARASGDVIFEASVGMAAEDRTGANQSTSPGRVLVSFETVTRDNKHRVDYAWVSATAGFGLAADGSNAELSSLELHILPAFIHMDELSDDCRDDTGVKTTCLYNIGVRIAPADISREVSFGLNGSVTIHAIGVQGELRNQAGTRLLQIFVDTIGIDYMRMAGDRPDLFGMDLLHIGVMSELTWHPFGSGKVALNYFPLVAEATLGFGKSGGDLFDDIPITAQAFSRLEASIQTAFGQYSAYIEGGAQALLIARPEPALTSDRFGALVARLGFQARF